MASLPITGRLILAVVLAAHVSVLFWGLYRQWRGWQIYHRIGNYSIGWLTFFTQLEQPGVNFPGPNVLEAQIARQPADFQAYVAEYRRRGRYLRRAVLSYVVLLVSVGLVVSLVRKFGN
jgi:hypothetical protein